MKVIREHFKKKPARYYHAGFFSVVRKELFRQCHFAGDNRIIGLQPVHV